MSSESISSQVIGAIFSLLEETGYPTFRTRMSGFNVTQLPAFNVIPGEAVPSLVAAGEQEWTMRALVHCVAASVDEVDLAIDPLFVAAQVALQQDVTLGGLVTSLRLKAWAFKTDSKAEQDLALLELQYEAEYSTVRGDPATATA